MLAGHSLLDHAVTVLDGQCDAVVVVGRSDAPVPTLADWPAAGMGPLAGLASALRYAAASGFDNVLSCAVDAHGLGEDLRAALSPAPAYVAGQPVIGLWPVSAVPAIETILASDTRHSLRAFAEAIGARAVALANTPANINTQADLAALENAHGL